MTRGTPLFPALFILLPLLSAPSAAWAGPPGAAPPAGPLTLHQVLAEVLAGNRDLAAQRAGARAAAAEAGEAGAARLPRLDLSASFTHTADVMAVPPAPGAAIDPAFFTGWTDQWSLHLGARQTLFSGGEVSGALDAAREGAQAAVLESAERELQAAYQAKELFYRLLLAQEQAGIAGEQLANARAHAADAGTRHRAGEVSRFELLRAKVRAANLEQPVAAAERARGETAAELSRQMGRPPDPALAVAGALAVTDDSIPAEAVSASLSRRPALAAATARWRAALASEEAAGGSRFPRLSLTAAYDTRADAAGDLFTPRNDNWSTGISLDYNLFDGGAASARRTRAAEQSAAASEMLARAAQGAALDCERALLALREGRAGRASAGETVAEAEEAVAIARVAYRAGSATLLEVADAEIGLASARTRLAEANYRFLSARAQWDYATGSLPPEVAP